MLLSPIVLAQTPPPSPSRPPPPPNPSPPPPSPGPDVPPGAPGYTVAVGQSCYNDCSGNVNDGFCDDGGPGSEHSLCAIGHDCIDCGGPRNDVNKQLCTSCPYECNARSVGSPLSQWCTEALYTNNVCDPQCNVWECNHDLGNCTQTDVRGCHVAPHIAAPRLLSPILASLNTHIPASLRSAGAHCLHPEAAPAGAAPVYAAAAIGSE